MPVRKSITQTPTVAPVMARLDTNCLMAESIFTENESTVVSTTLSDAVTAFIGCLSANPTDSSKIIRMICLIRFIFIFFSHYFNIQS